MRVVVGRQPDGHDVGVGLVRWSGTRSIRDDRSGTARVPPNPPQGVPASCTALIGHAMAPSPSLRKKVRPSDLARHSRQAGPDARTTVALAGAVRATVRWSGGTEIDHRFLLWDGDQAGAFRSCRVTCRIPATTAVSMRSPMAYSHPALPSSSEELNAACWSPTASRLPLVSR